MPLPAPFPLRVLLLPIMKVPSAWGVVLSVRCVRLVGWLFCRVVLRGGGGRDVPVLFSVCCAVLAACVRHGCRLPCVSLLPVALAVCAHERSALHIDVFVVEMRPHYM